MTRPIRYCRAPVYPVRTIKKEVNDLQSNQCGRELITRYGKADCRLRNQILRGSPALGVVLKFCTDRGSWVGRLNLVCICVFTGTIQENELLPSFLSSCYPHQLHLKPPFFIIDRILSHCSPSTPLSISDGPIA